jgi:NADPH:quinone reductase-like Zn-dependent oxidoreductase
VLGVHADGGLQTRLRLPASQLYPVPDALDDDTAVLAEPLSIAFRAVQRSAIGAGETAVVFGAGPIGLLIIQLLLRARGCRAVVIDIDRARLDLAARLGAVPVVGGGDAGGRSMPSLRQPMASWRRASSRPPAPRPVCGWRPTWCARRAASSWSAGATARSRSTRSA